MPTAGNEMSALLFQPQRRVIEALTVEVVGGEVVLFGATTATPTFTAAAARATGQRLIDAANDLESQSVATSADRRRQPEPAGT